MSFLGSKTLVVFYETPQALRAQSFEYFSQLAISSQTKLHHISFKVVNKEPLRIALKSIFPCFHSIFRKRLDLVISHQLLCSYCFKTQQTMQVLL